MHYYANSRKVKCQCLIENPEIDEISYCPRFLAPVDKQRLLDALSEELIEFGSTLGRFIMENDDVNFSPYFDYYYNDLAKALRCAAAALHLKQQEKSFI